ncbi:hypothetical protein V8G54_032884 [Vigna mungo]|uniref:Uncharacterized protein n=1 Tax=Vigna mungo TaxID=3915 RepID=A0AAQ3MM50_VIGMU
MFSNGPGCLKLYKRNMDVQDRSIARKDDRSQTNVTETFWRPPWGRGHPIETARNQEVPSFPHNHLISCRENRSCVLEGEEIINLAGKIVNHKYIRCQHAFNHGKNQPVLERTLRVVLSKSSTLLVASCRSAIDLALDTVGRDDNRTARSGLRIIRRTVRTNLCRVVRSSILINHEGSRSTTVIQKIVRMLGCTGHDAQGGHRVCKIKSSILGFCETFIDKEKSKSSAKITPTWVIILGQNQRLYEALEKNFEDSVKHVGRLNLTLKKNFLENISCGNVTAMRRKIGSICGYGRELPGYSAEEPGDVADRVFAGGGDLVDGGAREVRKMTPASGRPGEVCSGRSQENDFRKLGPTQEVRKMTHASGRPGEMCSGRSQENDFRKLRPTCVRGEVTPPNAGIQENDTCLRMIGGGVFGEKKMTPALGRLGEVCSGRSQENDFRKLRPTQEVRKMTPASR